MIGIIVSRTDPASVNIGEEILSIARNEGDLSRVGTDGNPAEETTAAAVYRFSGAELRIVEESQLSLDDVEERFSESEPALFVFASCHAGETGPLLTAHPTGNFGPATLGGQDHSLARAAPNAQKAALTFLSEHAPEGYDVGMEGTHHGPTEIDTPSLFVELGSDESQWNDTKGARAVARAILDLRGVEPTNERTIVGFGGGHYVPTFERIVRETNWTVGHVGVDWALSEMGSPDEDILAQAFERSGAEHALIDGDHSDLARSVRSLGYRIVSESWLRETSDAPLEFVAHLEQTVATIDDGLRFGAHADTDAEITRYSLPEELLAQANGIDRDRTLSGIKAFAVAVVCEENGTRLGNTVIAPASVDREDLINGLLVVLETKYERIERDGDRIIAHTTGFSPELARELGVPEGPAFGQLAAGKPVEIDGDRIKPEAVRERQTDVFSITE